MHSEPRPKIRRAVIKVDQDELLDMPHDVEEFVRGSLTLE
jgi:hypothetical protein